LQIHIWDKKESPGHTGKVRPNQQVRSALLVRLNLLVRPALHHATVRVQAIITSKKHTLNG
jgi:hypothetical protein